MPSKKPRKAALRGGNGSANGAGSQQVVPEPPADLEAAGLAVWSTCWALSRVERADAACVERLARLEDEAARLRAIVRVEGMVLEKPLISPKGQVLGTERYVHPAVAQLRRIDKEAGELCDALGLSPAGRRRLGLEMAPEPLEPDGVDELRKQIARRRGEPDPGVDGRRRW